MVSFTMLYVGCRADRRRCTSSLALTEGIVEITVFLAVLQDGSIGGFGHVGKYDVDIFCNIVESTAVR